MVHLQLEISSILYIKANRFDFYYLCPKAEFNKNKYSVRNYSILCANKCSKMKLQTIFGLIACLVTITLAQKDYELKRAFPRDCDSGYSFTCFKLDVVSFIDKMSDTSEYTVAPGIRLVRDAKNSSKNYEIVAGNQNYHFWFFITYVH